MGTLLFSISGLRGIVGSDLTPEIITAYAVAYGSFLKGGKIVVGRDTRASGDMIRHAVISGLLASGCEVIDLGVVPTPTVNLMVTQTGAQGGIAITASHNPIEWNALKFINGNGLFLNEDMAQRFFDFLKNRQFQRVGWNEIKRVDYLSTAIDIHIDRIINSILGSTRLRRLKVGIDAVNGAGSIALPRLLKKLGMQVFPLNCLPDGNFPRPPEPVSENLGSLRDLVREQSLDLGIAVDPDSDRLAIVDDQGVAIGEEMTLALAMEFVLTQRKGPVVTNLSTSRLIEDIASNYGVPLFRTKVGEANVVKKMREVSAVVGGEGNGGVILPEVNYTRDALVATALVISLINSRKKRLSEICKLFPKYFMVKKKVIMNNWEDKKGQIMQFIIEHPLLRNAAVDRTDGYKFTSEDIWVHIRSSQTEPIVRIISEGKDAQQVMNLVKDLEQACVG